MASKNSNCNGFTLIELLLIVAIIGVIMAIAIPQYATYRQRAFDTRSVTDLKNAATGESAYYASNESYIDCIGGSDCASSLPGFTASDGVDIAMFAGSGDYFVGRAYHPNGTKNNLLSAYIWNSSQGGLQ